MLAELTSTEKVLYRAALQFALDIEKLDPVTAQQRAMDKVLQKRKLVKKMSHFKY